MPKVVRIKKKVTDNASERVSTGDSSLKQDYVHSLEDKVRWREADIGQLNTQLNEVHGAKNTALNILREEYTYHTLRSLALRRELENFGITMPS